MNTTLVLAAGLAVLGTAGAGALSYAWLDARRAAPPQTAPTEPSAATSAPDGDVVPAPEASHEAPPAPAGFSFRRTFTCRRLLLLGAALLVSCYAAFRASGFGLSPVTTAKLFVTLAFLLSAMLVDKATRKIPNPLVLTMLGTGAGFLLLTFLTERAVFRSVLAASGIGLVGSFVAMLLLSLITRGGIGMGDVKLITAMGFLMGIAAVFYALVYAMLLCFLAALVLLALGKMKMKDALPFAPFLYAGFLMAIIFNTF